MARIPLGASVFERTVAQSPLVRLINRYFESDPTNQVEQAALLTRPALRRWLEVGDGPIRATYSQPGSFDDALFVVSNTNLYSVATDETIDSLGSVSSNATGFVSMAATDTHLFIADGGVLSVYDGATVAAITTPDDVGIISVGHLNGYIICVVADGFDVNGRFYWIEPGEITIDPLHFATAERAPDPLWAVRVVGDQFWLFGTNTTEIWYATGDSTAPFQRIQGRLFDRGVWEGTDVQIKDRVIVVDTDGVVYAVGSQPDRISNNSIEQRIRESMNTQKVLGL